MTSVFNLTMIIVLCMHWNACLQYLIAFLEGFPENSWVSKFGIDVSASVGLRRHCEKYTFSLFRCRVLM